MSDNEDDVSESGDNVGEYADDDESKERVIEQLRQNGLSLFPGDLAMHSSLPEPVQVELAKAERQNALVQRIILKPHDFSKSSADTMAKYLKRSKRLLHVILMDAPLTIFEFYSGLPYGFRRTWALCTFLEAIAESTSVRNLSLKNLDLEPACESFEKLLTRTKALRDVYIDLEKRGPLEEVATAAIASGFSKNTTLRKITLLNWQETSLISVLTALQMHPVLEVLQIKVFSSFNGIDVIVGSKQSQIKELIFVGFYGSTVEAVAGFESFMLEMGRNTTILKIVIAGVPLTRDSIQQLKAMLRRNTVLQDLDLSGNMDVNGNTLGSAGLAEIASALYRNTSIQGLNISENGLDDPAAAIALRELLRRNKTITRLSMDHNTFGSNDIVVRIIAEGFRNNTTLQVLDLSFCDLNDQGLSILAEGLGQQKRGLLNLNLSTNQITCSGLRALVDNATAALSTVTHLNLRDNLILDEGVSFLAEALRRQTLPSLKSLQLADCRGISDDGLVTLVSALEQNETLETINLIEGSFSAQGYLALASSLPNIKGLRQIDFSLSTTDPSVMSALLEGFRKNTSLHDVNIVEDEPGKDWLRELSFFLYRNKFGRLLQDSDTDDRASLGIWSRALGSVATRPDVLFHVLTSKAGLIRATPAEDGEDFLKRKRDDSE
jgi:hypothetical protein